jgi:EAL domain-containing protein (putative c-di-GMP-specific phosphodiesterase class I)
VTQAGVSPSSFVLTITPDVEISGLVQGVALKDNFAPPLSFQFDKLQAYMLKPDPKLDPLQPVQEGIVTHTHTAANTLKLFRLALPVASARAMAVIGLFVALVGLLALAVWISFLSRKSQEAMVRMKYGSMLIDVLPGRTGILRPTVDVMSVDDLARLAERNNVMILHEAHGKMHTYRVEGDQLTYRYTMIDGLEENGSTVPEVINSFDLRQAIDRDEFKVFYQPIVSLVDEKIIAVEALLRWQHPTNGLITAKDFIRSAESTGLIDSLGEWMLQEACTQLLEWRQTGTKLRLTVNFSKRQLEKDPVSIISRVLTKTGLGAEALQVEIQEESLQDDPLNILENLARLKELGVHISLDGFTGQTSVSELGKLPIDSVKIDRLVIEKVSQPRDAEYIQGIISAMLSQGLNVVAEGVETEEQMEFLRSQLCPEAQGYLIARPGPASELTSLLREQADKDREDPKC